MGRIRSIRFRSSWFIRSGPKIVRISALPFLVVSLTGWIPNKDLEFGPKGPWPWGALLGLLLIVVGLVGLFLPQETSWKRPSAT